MAIRNEKNIANIYIWHSPKWKHCLASAMQLYDWEAEYGLPKHVASWWTVSPAMTSTGILKHFKTVPSIKVIPMQKS